MSSTIQTKARRSGLNLLDSVHKRQEEGGGSGEADPHRFKDGDSVF